MKPGCQVGLEAFANTMERDLTDKERDLFEYAYDKGYKANESDAYIWDRVRHLLVDHPAFQSTRIDVESELLRDNCQSAAAVYSETLGRILDEHGEMKEVIRDLRDQLRNEEHLREMTEAYAAEEELAEETTDYYEGDSDAVAIHKIWAFVVIVFCLLITFLISTAMMGQ